MIIISRNPTEIIPNIRESYYETKVIAVTLVDNTRNSRSHKYAAMLNKRDDNYYWLGGKFGDGLGLTPWLSFSDYNHFVDNDPHSVLQCLIKTWEKYSNDFRINYFMLENQNEIEELFNMMNITNVDLRAAMNHRMVEIGK